MRVKLKVVFAYLLTFFSIYANEVNKLLENNKIHKLIIIGGGPAGLSAAISASRAQLNPIIITESPGGQLAKASQLDNWPGREPGLGIEIANDLRKRAKNLGTKFIYNTVVKVDLSKKPFKITLDDAQELLSHCLIIATGSQPKKLGCPGEEENLGNGIAICVTCDGPLFKNKFVVVIGGKFPALREVDILTKYTNKITIINKADDIKGPEYLVQKIKNNKNIRILNNSTAIQFIENNGWITGVKIINKDNKEEIIKTEGVFISTGFDPVTEIFKGQIDLNLKNQILVNNEVQTSVPGVFAAGDVTSNSRHQAPVASGFGYIAGMEAEEYLRKNKLL